MIPESEYAICFNYDQSSKGYIREFDRIDQGSHIYDGKLYKASTSSKYCSLSGYLRDPITYELYSLEDDVATLVIHEVCICGSPLAHIAPLASLNLKTPTIGEPPRDGEALTLLGFPVEINQRDWVIPQRPDIDNKLVEIAFSSMKPNCLIVTEGMLNASSNLLGITNSSVGGISGSPPMYNNGNEWVSCGVLIGGPAVSGHRALIEIVDMRGKGGIKQESISKITELTRMQPTSVFKYFEILMIIMIILLSEATKP